MERDATATRTIVKLVLNPAKGSNINVEVWLPDAEKWNARFLGLGNEEVWKDFGFRATHLMTVVGKQIVRAHFGKDPEFSYFSGGSTGGQQALQEAQRYPDFQRPRIRLALPECLRLVHKCVQAFPPLI